MTGASDENINRDSIYMEKSDIPAEVEKELGNIPCVVVVDPLITDMDGGRCHPPTYKTIREAARHLDRTGKCAIVIRPGEYEGTDNVIVQLEDSDKDIWFIGTGECHVGSLCIVSGVEMSNVVFYNVSSKVIFVKNAKTVICLGHTQVEDALIVGNSRVRLSDESRISSTDANAISYMSEVPILDNVDGGVSIGGNMLKGFGGNGYLNVDDFHVVKPVDIVFLDINSKVTKVYSLSENDSRDSCWHSHDDVAALAFKHGTCRRFGIVPGYGFGWNLFRGSGVG